MARATTAGDAANAAPGMPALIRVSTTPAFTVRTRTPAEAQRLRSPLRYAVRPAFAAP